MQGGMLSGLTDINHLDYISTKDSVLHRIDARAKVITVFAFIVCVVSFNKYELSSLLAFSLFPIAILSGAGIPLSYILKKVVFLLPFVFFIAIFNPVFDRAPMYEVDGIIISWGWISFASIILKFMLTVSAVFALIGSTGFNNICCALVKLGLPKIFVMQLMMLYRYIFVLADEASIMLRAYRLRSQGRSNPGIKIFSTLTGHLLLRTLARAQRINDAMLSRGFNGGFKVAAQSRFTLKDAAFMLVCILLFIAFRIYDVAFILGQIIERRLI